MRPPIGSGEASSWTRTETPTLTQPLMLTLTRTPTQTGMALRARAGAPARNPFTAIAGRFPVHMLVLETEVIAVPPDDGRYRRSFRSWAARILARFNFSHALSMSGPVTVSSSSARDFQS